MHLCGLKPLNENVLWEVHPLPKVETTLAQLSGARVFSKLDAPCGRFCYNKLPFGISSAPEHFQRCTSNILTGLPGIVCHVDDILAYYVLLILVYGKDQTQNMTPDFSP